MGAYMNSQREADKVLERMRLEEIAEKDAIERSSLGDSIKAALYARPRVLPAGVTREPILVKPLPYPEDPRALCTLLEIVDRMDKQIVRKVHEWSMRNVKPTTWKLWLKNANVTAGLGLNSKNAAEINRRVFEYYKVYLNQIICEGVEAGTYLHFERDFIK